MNTKWFLPILQLQGNFPSRKKLSNWHVQELRWLLEGGFKTAVETVAHFLIGVCIGRTPAQIFESDTEGSVVTAFDQ
ncbi:MAG: hypothetical protein ACI9LM_004696 [Alteromonadaceae bacterium]